MTEQPARYTLPGSEASEVQVHLLDGGSFSSATLSFIHANVSPDKFRLYDWCFLIFHRPSGRYVLWDLGCSDVGYLVAPKTSIPTTNRLKNAKSNRFAQNIRIIRSILPGCKK